MKNHKYTPFLIIKTNIINRITRIKTNYMNLKNELHELKRIPRIFIFEFIDCLLINITQFSPDHIISSLHHLIITSSHHHIITLSHYHIITSTHHHIITSTHGIIPQQMDTPFFKQLPGSI